jgi:hypothetical protein
MLLPACIAPRVDDVAWAICQESCLAHASPLDTNPSHPQLHECQADHNTARAHVYVLVLALDFSVYHEAPHLFVVVRRRTLAPSLAALAQAASISLTSTYTPQQHGRPQNDQICSPRPRRRRRRRRRRADRDARRRRQGHADLQPRDGRGVQQDRTQGLRHWRH